MDQPSEKCQDCNGSGMFGMPSDMFTCCRCGGSGKSLDNPKPTPRPIGYSPLAKLCKCLAAIHSADQESIIADHVDYEHRRMTASEVVGVALKLVAEIQLALNKAKEADERFLEAMNLMDELYLVNRDDCSHQSRMDKVIIGYSELKKIAVKMRKLEN